MSLDRSNHRLTLAEYDRIVASARAARAQAIAGFGREAATWLLRPLHRMLRGGWRSRPAGHLGTPMAR